MTIANRYGLPVSLPAVLSRLNEKEIVCTTLRKDDVDISALVQNVLQISRSEPENEPCLATDIPFLYHRSDANCPLSIAYAIKRSLKSLASTIFFVKVNNALFLQCLLGSVAHQVSASTIMDWIDYTFQKPHLAGNHHMNTTEETAMIAGRLLSYDILSSIRPSEVTERIIDGVLNIWTSSIAFCFICQSIIRTVLTTDKVAGIAKSKIACKINNSLKAVQRNVALSMVLNVRHLGKVGSFAQTSPNWSQNLLSPEGITTIINSIDYGNLENPLTFTLPFSLFASLIVEKQQEEFSFAWPTFVSRLMESGRAAPQLVIRLLQALVSETETCAEFDNLLLSSQVLEILSRTGTELELSLTILSDLSAKSRVLVCKNLLISDKGLALARALLLKLDDKAFEETAMDLTSGTLEGPVMQRYLDLLLSILKRDNSPPALRNSVVRAGLNSLCSEICNQEALSPRVQNMIYLAFFSAAESTIECLKERLTYCNSIIAEEFNLETKPGKRRFKALDRPVKDAWKSLMKLSKKIERFNSSLKDFPQESAIIASLDVMTCAGTLLLILDPLAGSNIADDLTSAFNDLKARARAKASKAESTVEPVEVLTEIVLQWLSRPSSLLRTISRVIFSNMLPCLTPSALQSIIKILTTPPDEAQDDLMEDECADAGPEEATPNAELEEKLEFSAPNPKRAKAEESAESSCESEVINLEHAESADLQLLDDQLASIMASQKSTIQAKRYGRDALIHFKIRICDLLDLILAQDGDKSLKTKVTLLPKLLDALKLLEVPAEKEKGLGNQELSKRLKTVFQQNYVLGMSFISKSTEIDVTDCNEALSSVLQFVTDNAASRPDLMPLCFQAFWFLIVQYNVDSSTFCEKLQPLWLNLLHEGDKKHSSKFLSFFEMIRSRSPVTILQLISSQSSLVALASARHYTRDLLFRFVEPIFQGSMKDQRSAEITQRLSEIAAFLKSGFVDAGVFTMKTAKQLKEELASICKFICKSRSYLGIDAATVWGPALQQILEFIQAQSAFEKNQRCSLRSRVLDCLNLIKP